MDKGICEAASQADTFIEQCFERKCQRLKDGEDILNQWRNDKAEYSSVTNMTGFDFQHYSMHDKSHSVTILRYIEMVLGQDRVEMLCASDLWLLLESAYSHDIGMSLTYDDLCGLWRDENFKKYVKDSLYAETVDQRKAAAFYYRLDDLVHDKKLFTDSAQIDEIEDPGEFEEEFDEFFNRNCWAVVCVRYIMLLYTDYIRKKHPEQSKQKIIEYGVHAEKKIAQRMYWIVANVIFLHGMDFDNIFTEVHKCDNGFEAETLHPQFAAAMLRLGDLLDMDSNRFDLRMLKHMGIGLLPIESMLQLKKHKSITHLSYSSSEIQAETRSDEIEVCKTANRWFMMLNREVQDLICNWNGIVPEELIGCRLKKCDLKIYLNGEKFEAGQQMKFKVDPVRVYDMLIGNNIYHSRLDFIREYLQNAMDASNMRLWLNLKEKLNGDDGGEKNVITPFDLELSWYKQCQIEVGAELNWEKGTIIFSFQDHGIGMEKECVENLSTVASDSWRKRSGYSSEIQSMPAWLRPTGGFGIGVQSAFMIADSVEFETCSEKEGIGRRVRLDSNKKGGMVSVAVDRKIVKGTKVLIEVRMMEFLKEVLEHEGTFELDVQTNNVFDSSETPKVVLHILEKYIQKVAKYSMVPIRISCGREKAKYVGMEWAGIISEEEDKAQQEFSRGLNDFSQWKKFPLTSTKTVKVAGERYEIRFQVRNNGIYLWDCTKGNMVICSLFSSIWGRTNCYYKGILIQQETLQTSDPYSLDVVYFDDIVSRNLTVNRDMFKTEKRNQYREDLEHYRCILALVFANDFRKFKDEETTKRIALRALALDLSGVIKLEQSQITRLKEVSGNILVRTVDHTILDSLEENINLFLSKGGSNDQKDVSYLELARIQMYQVERISYEDLVASVKKNAAIIYHLEETGTMADEMKFGQYLSKIREYGKKAGEEISTKDFVMPWDEAICKLSQPKCYTIIERDMCDVLRTNIEGYERKELKLVIRGNYADGFFVLDKLSHTAPKNKETLQRFIRHELVQRVEESRIFPIVLHRNCLLNKEPLWIYKSFPGVIPILLDGPEKSKGSFLLLPFTRSMWNELMREKENNSLTKEKYDGIVKDPEKAKLYIDWTYCWQTALEPKKLKKAQIWEEYIKLLDQIYKWLFK